MNAFKATGLAHLGIPVKNVERSRAFYAGLGFDEIFRSDPGATGFPVLFMQNGGLVLELYGLSEQACGKSGAINHLALETDDINAAYASAKARGLLPEGETVHSMPVFQNGVRFFTIQGPDGEKIEFNQRL